MKQIERRFCECTVHYSEKGISGKDTEMKYLGNACFQCPKCKHIEDMSSDTYNLRLKFSKDEEDYFQISVVGTVTDPRLLKHNTDSGGKEVKSLILDALRDDLQETGEDEFEGHELGIFDVELLWNWYRTSYEYEEYDLNLRIIAEEVIDQSGVK